jgi:hypothetical protein
MRNNNVIQRSSEKGMAQCCRKGTNSILAYAHSNLGKLQPEKKKLSCDLIHR